MVGQQVDGQKHQEPIEIFAKVPLDKSEGDGDRKHPKSNGTSGSLSKRSSSGGDSERTKIRFYICTLSLLVLTTSQMSRMVFNQSIPVMVDLSKPKNNTASTTIVPLETQTDETTIDQMNLPTEVSLMTTSLAPTTETPTELTTTRELISDKTVATSLPPPSDASGESENSPTMLPVHETFKWTNDDRSTLMGAFYWGYFLFMIPGGRFAEAYGSKYVLLVSVGGSAIINLLTPWLARNNFFFLVLSRFVLGSIQAGVIPGIYALFNQWLTISETSIFAPLVKTNLRLGMMFGSALCGFNKYDWPTTFYSTGFFCALFAILWVILATSNPKDNRWVSKSEVQHINKKKRKEPQMKEAEEGQNEIELEDRTGKSSKESRKQKKVQEKTPWLKLILNPSVIGLIMVKLVFNYSIDFLVILLPSYLAAVHHAEPQTISYITIPMFGLQAVLVVFVGWLAKYVVKERPFDLSKTAIRKIFQITCNGGMAISMILLTFNNYNLIYVALMLQIMSFLSMFTAGGDTMLPYDLSDKYPATIMAIANCIGNISGVTTLELSRYVLRGQPDSYDQWNKLISIVAGANIVGCLGFVLLVKAEPIDFSSSKRSTKKEEKVVSVEAPNGVEQV